MIREGIALSQGNLGNRIRVRLFSGSIVNAIAQTNIIGGRVTVIQDERTKQYYCLSQSSPLLQQKRTLKLYKSRPVVVEKETSNIVIIYSISE
jgi:hypothetical protein